MVRSTAEILASAFYGLDLMVWWEGRGAFAGVGTVLRTCSPHRYALLAMCVSRETMLSAPRYAPACGYDTSDVVQERGDSFSPKIRHRVTHLLTRCHVKLTSQGGAR